MLLRLNSGAQLIRESAHLMFEPILELVPLADLVLGTVELLMIGLSFVFGIPQALEGGLLALPATPRLGVMFLLDSLSGMHLPTQVGGELERALVHVARRIGRGEMSASDLGLGLQGLLGPCVALRGGLRMEEKFSSGLLRCRGV